MHLLLAVLLLLQEETFAAKYPRRPSSEWVTKLQKYKPPGTEETVSVKLGELVRPHSRVGQAAV